MTDAEIRRTLRKKWPSCQAKAQRKYAMRHRYKGRLAEAIAETEDKLRILREMQAEMDDG